MRITSVVKTTDQSPAAADQSDESAGTTTVASRENDAFSPSEEPAPAGTSRGGVEEEGSAPGGGKKWTGEMRELWKSQTVDEDPGQDSIQSNAHLVVSSFATGEGMMDSVDRVGEINTVAMTSSMDAATMAAEMAAAGRMFGKELHNREARRLVQKSGDCNVISRNVTKRNRSYLVDIFTTLVDMRWRLHIILFTSAFCFTWIFFACIWWIIAAAHGDDEIRLLHNETWKACVDNVYDFQTSLLFSIETQHTIGYGTRVITNECWIALIVMMAQSCVGMVVQSLITGIIFAKISRPKGRAQTIMFSQKAVICQRDGEYYLLFRVGDMRKSHIIGTSLRAILVKNRLTREGESIPLCQYPLSLETETSHSECFVFLIWPMTIVHRIDAQSPLWDMSADQLFKDHFEIIVILEGTVESTGSFTQVRTSYIPREIGWGEHLVPLLTFQLQNGRYEIDYSQFHNTLPVSTMPSCSAKDSAASTTRINSDYPISFTAPAVRAANPHRSVYGLFHRHLRTAGGSTADKSSIVKRKANAAKERRLPGDWIGDNSAHGSTATVADPTQVGPAYHQRFKTLLQQSRGNGPSGGKGSMTLPSRAKTASPERRNVIDFEPDGGSSRLDGARPSRSLSQLDTYAIGDVNREGKVMNGKDENDKGMKETIAIPEVIVASPSRFVVTRSASHGSADVDNNNIDNSLLHPYYTPTFDTARQVNGLRSNRSWTTSSQL